MTFLTNQVGVNLTEDKIQLVEIVKKENKLFLENADEEFFEESIFENTKEAKYIHILQNAFNEIVLRNPLISTKISFTLPTNYFYVFEIPVDKNLTKSDLNDYIKWELSKLFPEEKSNNFTFQKIVLDSLNFQTVKRVLVFSIRTENLKRIHKFCVRNNLQLKNIDNAHVSSANLFLNKESNSTLLSIYVEQNRISCFLFANKNLLFEKHSKYKNVAEIPQLIELLQEEINSREIVKNSIEQLFVFGTSSTNELKNSLADLLKLQLNKINPFEEIVFPQDLNNKSITENPEKFAAAASIALRLI